MEVAMTDEERLSLVIENVQVSIDPTHNKPYYYCKLNNKSGWTLEEVVSEILNDPDAVVGKPQVWV
jgi:hypothetical protein